MKKLLLSFVALLLCAMSVGTANAKVYFKGSMNDWGTDNEMISEGNNNYSCMVTIPQNAEFKINDGDSWHGYDDNISSFGTYTFNGGNNAKWTGAKTAAKVTYNSSSKKVTIAAIEIPDGLVYYEGTFSVFVINNKNWSTVNAWIWASANYTGGEWPGHAMKRLSVKAGSHYCYQWTYTGSLTTVPTSVIFNNGSAQTDDLTYKNGGVYLADGTLLGTIEATPVVKPTVTIGGDTEVYQGDEVTYTATVLNGDDLTVAFYVNGTKQTTGVNGSTLTLTAPDDNFTVQAKLLDGETLKAESEVLNVTVKEHINVTFTVTVPEGTENVNIAGSFNGWSETATPMEPQGNNVFTVTIQDIDVETVSYKYVTNQTWANVEVTVVDGKDADVANRSYNENDVVAKWKGIDIYYAQNITCEKVYYLDISKDLGDGQTWAEGGAWFAAYFFNKNTDAETWVKGQVAGTSVLFYLATDNVPTRSGEDPVYTHVIFCRMNDAFSTMEWDVYDGETLIEDHVWNQTGDLTYDGTKTNVYNLTGWETAEQLAQIPSAIEGVEVADGIRYAYGVVEAEGAIEVYSINGAVVARGNDIVDLRGLNRGIYIVRNGDQVRKVVR